MTRAVTISAFRDPADTAAVRRLFEDYARELGIDLSFQGFTGELRSLPGSYSPPDGALLVASRGDEAVGVVALQGLRGCPHTPLPSSEPRSTSLDGSLRSPL